MLSQVWSHPNPRFVKGDGSNLYHVDSTCGLSSMLVWLLPSWFLLVPALGDTMLYLVFRRLSMQCMCMNPRSSIIRYNSSEEQLDASYLGIVYAHRWDALKEEYLKH